VGWPACTTASLFIAAASKALPYIVVSLKRLAHVEHMVLLSLHSALECYLACPAVVEGFEQVEGHDSSKSTEQDEQILFCNHWGYASKEYRAVLLRWNCLYGVEVLLLVRCDIQHGLVLLHCRRGQLWNGRSR